MSRLPALVEAAQDRALKLGLGDRALYRVGSFENTGLADGRAAAVMSVDSLLFTPDKKCALSEMARVLCPGGRLVFTSWDYHEQPVGRPPQVDDHRPLLVASGFQVLAYDETPHWRERQEQTGELLLASIEELAAESGESPNDVRSEVEEMNATIATMSRRFFAAATRI